MNLVILSAAERSRRMSRNAVDGVGEAGLSNLSLMKWFRFVALVAFAAVANLLHANPQSKIALVNGTLINPGAAKIVPNAVVVIDGDRITAVLDWGSSKYGDFLFDIANLVFYRPWFPAWRNIDFAAEARAHYDAIGLAVPNFAERLACYTLRIALDGMSYSAFRKRWNEVELRGRRALDIARS